jgi:hypothetical protein
VENAMDSSFWYLDFYLISNSCFLCSTDYIDWIPTIGPASALSIPINL